MDTTTSKTILVVDDSNLMRLMICRTLQQSGYNVIEATNGEEAITQFQSFHPDAILMDVTMPVMDGFTACSKIRLLPGGEYLPIMIVTGLDDIESINKAYQMGATDFLAKPINWGLLPYSLRNVLRTYQYFQELQLGRAEIGQKNILLEDANKELNTLNRQLEHRINVFNQFVPREFLNILKVEGDFIELGMCSEKEVTVMFTDIRSFTKLSEKLSLDEVFNFINHHLHDVGVYIRQYEGFIDKYIGDSVMAIFTNPDHAIQAAIEILDYISEYNKKTDLPGHIPYRIGIGINTGLVMMGTIGEHHHIQTTVIGDTVNLAAYTESLTKTFSTPLLITRNTYNALKNTTDYTCHFINTVTVKGKEQPMDIFEIKKKIHE